MKRILACLCLAALLLPTLVGCPTPGDGGSTTTTTTTTTTTSGSSNPDQPQNPTPPVSWDPTPENLQTAKKYPYIDEETNTLYMTYQSSYTFENRINEIKDVVINSKVTGTDTADAELLVKESNNKTVTAVGTGTATVVFRASEMKVVVVPAPLNLLFVTGQSNAAAEADTSAGTRQDYNDLFVRSENKKAYYSHVSAGISIAEGSGNQPNMYIPNNLVWNTCYTNRYGGDPRLLTYEKGTTSTGSGWSGLAHVWTKETGEYVWIVNSSFGGMPIHTFQPTDDGSVIDNNYYRSLTSFREALKTVYREVDAGHFTLNHMAYYWCQGESDGRSLGAKEYHDSFVKMHAGYMRDLVYDHEGVKKELEFCGISVVRSAYDSYSNSLSELHLTGPRLMQYYAGGVSEGVLRNVFVVSNVTERWTGSDQNVVDYFTETYGSAEEFLEYFGYEMPTTRRELHPVIHYNIRGYNEISMEAGRNSLRLINLFLPENGYDTSLDFADEKPTVTLTDVNGHTTYGDILFLDSDTESAVIYPAITPLYRTVQGLELTTDTPGFRIELYTIYREDPTATSVKLTIKLGGKVLEEKTMQISYKGSFGYNLPNIINHGTSGDPDYEWLGARGSWKPGIYTPSSDAFVACDHLQSGYAWLLPPDQTQWYLGVGGFGGSSGYTFGTGYSSSSTLLALEYTVKEDTKIGIGFDHVANVANFAEMAVYVNGDMIFPKRGGSLGDFIALDGTVDVSDLNEAVENVRVSVKAGDRVYFVVRTPRDQGASSQTLLHPVVYYYGKE